MCVVSRLGLSLWDLSWGLPRLSQEAACFSWRSSHPECLLAQHREDGTVDYTVHPHLAAAKEHIFGSNRAAEWYLYRFVARYATVKAPEGNRPPWRNRG